MRTRLVLPFLSCFVSVSFAQAPTSSSPEIERKVDAVLAKMTLEQKIDMLGGFNGFGIRGYPSLGLPVLQMADGPVGVRNDGPATAMAGGIALAASWNPVLAERVGVQIARDARAKGKHFLLGPGVNIYRSPLNGRNFEYLGEDPLLGSRIAVAYINGVQSQGVAATIKHFMANNSEFDRHDTDSVIDERTMREIYLPIFEAAVKEAHVAAVMASYNLTNGEHMTQNSAINNGILKRDWGFKGILMSDWSATYDAVGAANGGLDLEMPSGRFLNRENLLRAIQSGAISEDTINDKIRRILRVELTFGWPDREQQDLSLPRYNQQGREIARQAAREGIVLLKNAGDALPLNRERVKTIAVIGPGAHPAVPVGGGSAQVVPFHGVSVLEGISNYLAPTSHMVTSATGIASMARAAATTSFQVDESSGRPGLKLETFSNEDLSGTPAGTGTTQHITLGVPFDISATNTDEASSPNPQQNQIGSERWIGYYVPKAAGTFDVFVQQGGFAPGGFRMYLDGKLQFDNWDNQKFVVAQTSVVLDARPHKIVFEHHSGRGLRPPFVRMGIVQQNAWVDPVAEELASKADVVVIAAGFDPTTETEGWDRTFQLPPGQNELIRRIAARNKNTVVVLTSGGAVDMRPWLDQVAAVIEAWYPGQEGGTALAEILFGDVSPSGRLPVTFERQWEDNPAYRNYYPVEGSNRVAYREGVFLGYRGYEHNGTKPLFPFGYGLSYTTFKYGNLTADQHGVAFEVTNTGSRAADAVVQLYIAPARSSVPRPAKELKGFSRVPLRPGETKAVKIPLNTRSFAYYDVQTKEWRAEAGAYEILVGSSSEQIELTGQVTLAAHATER
jgi:beta-glucosidase